MDIRIDKQYCYFVIGSVELYRLNEVSVLGSARFIPEGIHWKSQQHDLLLDIVLH